jgi:hypothetical protein
LLQVKRKILDQTVPFNGVIKTREKRRGKNENQNPPRKDLLKQWVNKATKQHEVIPISVVNRQNPLKLRIRNKYPFLRNIYSLDDQPCGSVTWFAVKRDIFKSFFLDSEDLETIGKLLKGFLTGNDGIKGGVLLGLSHVADGTTRSPYD